MLINFSPVRSDDDLELIKKGDSLTINGQTFDFAPLPDGATLPADAIGSDHFAGPVERVGGVLQVTLRLPHGPNPPYSVAFPESVYVNEDGVITLPTDEVSTDD